MEAPSAADEGGADMEAPRTALPSSRTTVPATAPASTAPLSETGGTHRPLPLRGLALALLAVHGVLVVLVYTRFAAAGFGQGDVVWRSVCHAAPVNTTSTNMTATTVGSAGCAGCAPLNSGILHKHTLTLAMAGVHAAAAVAHGVVLAALPALSPWVADVPLVAAAVVATVLISVDMAAIQGSWTTTCGDGGGSQTTSYCAGCAGNVVVVVLLPLACELAMVAVAAATAVARGRVRAGVSEASEGTGEGEEGDGVLVVGGWGFEAKQLMRAPRPSFQSLEVSVCRSLGSCGSPESAVGECSALSSKGRLDPSTQFSADEKAACAVYAVAIAAGLLGRYAEDTHKLRVRYYWQVPKVAEIIAGRHRPLPILPAPRIQLITDIAEDVRGHHMHTHSSANSLQLAAPPAVPPGPDGDSHTSAPNTPQHPNLVHTATDASPRYISPHGAATLPVASPIPGMIVSPLTPTQGMTPRLHMLSIPIPTNGLLPPPPPAAAPPGSGSSLARTSEEETDSHLVKRRSRAARSQKDRKLKKEKKNKKTPR